MIHLTIQQLSTFLDGESTETSATLAQEHLAACETCALKLTQLQSLETTLAEALVSDRDDAFFERLTKSIEERVEKQGRKTLAAALPAPVPEPMPVREILPEPERRPVRTVREAHAPRAIVREAATASSGFPWGAALVMFALAGGVAALIFGNELVSYWIGTSGLHGSTPVAADQIASREVLAAGDRTATSASLNGNPAVVPPPSDQEEALPSASTKPHRDPAKELEPVVEPKSEGDVPDSVAVYEAVAAEWESSLASLHGDDYQTARFQLAEARYRVWQLDPSEQHGTKLSGAVRAYLVGAPPGPERDQAMRWLTEVQGTRY